MIVENQTLDEERALYGCDVVTAVNCKFQGPADGESAFKECGRAEAKNCLFDLRYPFWHDRAVNISDCKMTENCRAALWYSDNIVIDGTEMHGIKALRECKNAVIKNSDIVSPEFGWSTDCVRFENVKAVSEYFLMRARRITADGLDFKGKYSFQYVKDVLITNSRLDTKDAFWHGENITVENSTVIGEYLAWYSKNLTFRNCTIIGTQPFCYCKNLKLIDCVMQKTDLAFERSEANATLLEPIDSIKNFYKGTVKVPAVGEIMRDDVKAKGKIIITNTN